jgi:hypothetical protein
VGGSLPRRPRLRSVDRSSAPHLVANRTCERRIEAIAALRRLRFTGPEIPDLLGIPQSTVSGILTRIGTGRLGRLGRSRPSATSASGLVSTARSTARLERTAALDGWLWRYDHHDDTQPSAAYRPSHG